MQARLDYMKAAPDAVQAVYALERYTADRSGLEPRILHLLKLRASQMNGCAFCVDMHTREARSDGLPEQWIALICVWREATIFDARERAVLAWTEAVTDIAGSGAPDDAYDAIRAHFSEAEVVRLTVAISTINVWNRLAVSFRTPHAVEVAA
ncbi:carboxymuconolactone decarboxylase family protein [Pontivivens ytuae]|uniref:Carboxymuconolactone decarboxylase family protein n=2 Tax=Pontivivens ytuae TaxID=2789856 RepID=A0A7S9LWC5_9RHOB|nr:carboxymuconolactone decarboxylase family protein [Pontivivens ytuae]